MPLCQKNQRVLEHFSTHDPKRFRSQHYGSAMDVEGPYESPWLQNSTQIIISTGWSGAAGLDMCTACMTNFRLTDVVRCMHAIGDTCMECVGRVVHNVPLPAFKTWETPCPRDFFSSELTYPALTSLAAMLHLSGEERILYINSGCGHTAIAWALLFRNVSVSCLESCSLSHRAAMDAVCSLDPSLQQRARLFRCDPWSAQGDCRDANILVANVGVSRTQDSVARILTASQEFQKGTRVVILSVRVSVPTTASIGVATPGLILTHRALYRMASGANMQADVYTKF